MPLPPGVTTRAYTGTIVGLDGTNATGILEFRHPQPIYDADNNVVVGPQKPITATVTAGTFTANLPISENPYVVRVATDALRDVYLLLVTAGSGPLTFAGTYGTAASPELADFYVLQATFNALAVRVADLEETGGVSVPDATTTTKGLIRLAGDLGGTAAAPIVLGLAAKYIKPGGGIPSSDLAAAVQALLTLAGTAVQPGALATVATTGAYADLVGTVPSAALPAIAVTEYLGAVANQAAMLALTGQLGDWCTRTDLGTTWVITGSNPAQLASWTALSYPAAPVVSVNGQTGTVTLAKGDIGLGNVANLAPADLPVSTAQQAALDLKAALTVTDALDIRIDALEAGGGGGASFEIIEARITSGNVAWPDTAGAWAKPGDAAGLPVGFRLTLTDVQVGDWVEIGVRAMRSDTTSAYVELAVQVGSSIVRYLTTGTGSPAFEGDTSWYPNNTFRTQSAPAGFFVTSGDIDSGQIRFVLANKSAGSGTLYASSQYPFWWVAKRWRQ